MGFMKPKIPPAPSPEDIARMQDKISQEREARAVKIESEIKRNEAANALRSGMRRKKGRGTLVTRRGGSSYIGVTNEPLAPTYDRTLLG
jgi:hypothetical protein